MAEAAAGQSLGRPVALGRPRRFTVQGRWAFVIAPLRGEDGGAFHYPAGSPQAGAVARGMVSHDYVALLSSSGSGWSVVATAVGATDAMWASWPATYGAPASLFPRVL